MPYQNNPYMLSPEEQQQLTGIPPVMQNIAAQQANQNAAMQQQLANNQAAGQVAGNGQGNLALAMALRKDKKKPTEAVKKDVEALGSSTWNPLSDYNTGANGWGNFGE